MAELKVLKTTKIPLTKDGLLDREDYRKAVQLQEAPPGDDVTVRVSFSSDTNLNPFFVVTVLG